MITNDAMNIRLRNSILSGKLILSDSTSGVALANLYDLRFGQFCHSMFRALSYEPTHRVMFGHVAAMAKKENVGSFIVKSILIFMMTLNRWISAFLASAKIGIELYCSIPASFRTLCVGIYAPLLSARAAAFRRSISKLFPAVGTLPRMLSIVNRLHFSTMLRIFEGHLFMKQQWGLNF